MSTTPSSWLRRNIAWSNSRQSWEERIGIALLAAGAGLVVWYSSRLSLVQQVVAWAALVLAAAVLLRRGWLKLFGPVLFYDMIRTARRGRYVLLRCLYAAFLLLLLWPVFMESQYRGQAGPQRAARMAEDYFAWFMIVQLSAVALLTPAYVAGAIADEKQRRTLEFLLATDLRNREIVLSKLGSRMANLTLFVLTGLPILSLLQFLGGVDPDLVLGGFALTGLTMLGAGGVSILMSAMFKRPRDAVAMSYLVLLAYVGLSLALKALQAFPPISGIFSEPIWFGETPPTLGDAADWFHSGNLLVLLVEIFQAMWMGTLGTVGPSLLGRYAVFNLVIGLGCTAWAVLRLRALALRQLYDRPKRGSRALLTGARPEVGSQPMLWKEIHVEGGLRFNWLTRIVTLLLVLATLAPAALILGLFAWEHLFGNRWAFRGGWHDLAEAMNIWEVRIAGTCVACLMLLAVAVRASSAVSSERDRQTFDALLTSPLDGPSILGAKWLGCLLSLRWAWLWLGLIWGLGILTGGLSFLALPLLAVAWGIYAGIFAMIGLWFSLVFRSTLRATVWSLATAILISVGHWLVWMCCGPVLAFSAAGGSHRFVEIFVMFETGFTPPAVLGILAFEASNLESHGGLMTFPQLLLFCLFGLFVWAVAGVGFWFGLLLPRFRALTNREHPDWPQEPHRWRPPRERERRKREIDEPAE